MLTDWWSSLDLLLKVLWCIATATTLIFVIQSLLTFIGVDTGGDTDLDMPEDLASYDVDPSMNLFTFRNLVNFLLGFSWTGILFHDTFRSTALTMIVAVFVGLLLVFIVMMLFKWLAGMQQSGNINVYKSAVGCQGKVYLTIPAQRKGAGKIQITINESVREYDALTDTDEIPTGTPIRVVEVLDDCTMLVEPLEPTII